MQRMLLRLERRHLEVLVAVVAALRRGEPAFAGAAGGAHDHDGTRGAKGGFFLVISDMNATLPAALDDQPLMCMAATTTPSRCCRDRVRHRLTHPTE